MSIVLDAMGSDDHPVPEIQAAAQLALSGEKVILVGKKDLILSKAASLSIDLSNIEIGCSGHR